MPFDFRTPVNASQGLFNDSASLRALINAGWDTDTLTNTKGNPEFGVLHRSWVWTAQGASTSPMGLTAGQSIAPAQGTGSKPAIGTQSVVSTVDVH